MSQADKAATQEGVVNEGVTNNEAAESAVALREPLPKTERELAMERMASSASQRHGVNLPTEPATNEGEARATVEVTDAALQIGKQLDDGTWVLDAGALDRVMVPTKVNGVEELVPATKALAQFQKNNAADVKLQNATAEANRILADANEKFRQAAEAVAKAATPSEKKEAKEAAEDAQANLDAVQNEFLDALYDGDKEKAAKAFSSAIKLVAKSAVPTTPEVHQPAAPSLQETVAAVKQHLTVESALDALFQGYPQIKTDPDLALIADTKVNAFVAEGKPLPEAIALAGEYVGEKYKIGKFEIKDAPKEPAATAREQKLAAKERLDEPTSTAARAASAEPVPQTRSAIIAEMQAARVPQ